MRAYLKKCLVPILLVVVFDSACWKSNTPVSRLPGSAAVPSFGAGFCKVTLRY